MRLLSLLSVAALAASLLVSTAHAQEAKAPYTLEIWAEASYDTAGKLASLEFPAEKLYPPALIGNLRARADAHETTPRQHEGQPATFDTGLRFTLTVTPATNSVTVDELAEAPMVTMQVQPQFSSNTANAQEWKGSLVAACTVSRKGRCTGIEVVDNGGMDVGTARQLARTALGAWRFKPQKVAGEPVEASFQTRLTPERTGVTRPTLRDRQN